jgi:hypothetical protein
MDQLGKALGRAGRKKKGRKSDPSVEGVETIQTRSANFSKEETDLLLIAAQEIQSNTGKTNLNFTTHEYQQVHAFFFCQDQQNRADSGPTYQ